MAGRPALITQAEVARVCRAAIKAGAAAVEVKRDGGIMIHLSPQSPITTVPEDVPVDEGKIVPL